jgi:endo-beta-N-acetylglucosaminidase D
MALSAPEKTGAYGELGYTGGNVHGASQDVITGRLGWRFNRFLGAEGELGVGVSTGDRTFDNAGTSIDVGVKQKTQEAAYAVGYLPLTPRADLFARAGYGWAQYDVNPAGAANYNAHTDGFRYGAGGQYFFDGQNGLRLDWTHYDVQNVHDAGGYFGGDKSSDLWSVAFSHRF